MQLLPLLGKKLKDDEVIEILERSDIEVIYDFDRLHEGQPDIFWATSNRDGFQFKFDATHKLVTVFLHIIPSDGYAAFSPHDCDIPFFSSAQEVDAFGKSRSLQVARGRADLSGVSREWLRLGFGTYSIHYEFHAGRLALVTVSGRDKSAA